MYFNLKRFYYGIVKRQRILLFILIIPFAYLFFAAFLPDRFKVEQEITIHDSTPVASAINPMSFKPFGELKKNSADFFSNQFDVNNSARMVVSGLDEKYSLKTIKEAVLNCNFITAKGADRVILSYNGKHLDLGRILVTYYSDRLLIKSQEGIYRSRLPENAIAKPFFYGDLKVIKLRSLWRPERSTPLMISIVISILFVSILLGFLEWADPSFKSERQIARYTGLPIIGALPDLNKLSKRIKSKSQA